jgi:hypothetical protein
MSTPKIFKPTGDELVVGPGGKITVQAGGRIVVEEGGVITGPQLPGAEAELLTVDPHPPVDNLPKQTTVAETAAKVNVILDALRAAGIIANPAEKVGE